MMQQMLKRSRISPIGVLAMVVCIIAGLEAAKHTGNIN